MKCGMPGFCKPIEFIKPLGISQTRTPVFPWRGSIVKPLEEIPPSRPMLKTDSYSVPKPKVPELAMTGFFNRKPPMSTLRSALLSLSRFSARAGSSKMIFCPGKTGPSLQQRL